MIKQKKFILAFVFSVVFCLTLAGIFRGDLDSQSLVYAQSSPPVAVEVEKSPPVVSPSSVTTPATVTPTKTESSETKVKKADTSKIRIKDIYRFGITEKDPRKQPDRNQVAINDIIALEISNFKSYYENVLCKQADSSCLSKLVLSLEGRKLTTIPAESIEFDKEDAILTFHLRRDKDNDEIWVDLLGNPGLNSSFFDRNTKATVSLRDGAEEKLIVEGKSFQLVRFRPWYIAFWIILIGAVIVACFKEKGSLYSLISERGLEPTNGKKPYSLSRCQMALWLALTIFSYILIYMATGATDTLNESVLGLLGIGAGTTLGARLIDADIDTGQAKSSDGFWKDLLSSPSKQEGLGLHRLQLILWTIVIAVVFVVSVYNRLSMPQLSPTLLALQGIVSGTYLGFKFPENKPDIQRQGILDVGGQGSLVVAGNPSGVVGQSSLVIADPGAGSPLVADNSGAGS
jgi:hypothetical protein